MTATAPSPAVRAYLSTLLLLPADIVLDIATRDLDLENRETCLCGWALRDAIAKRRGITPERANVDRAAHNPSPYDPDTVSGVVTGMEREFGGTFNEWDAIFRGVTDYRMPIIEEAFLLRLEMALQGV